MSSSGRLEGAAAGCSIAISFVLGLLLFGCGGDSGETVDSEPDKEVVTAGSAKDFSLSDPGLPLKSLSLRSDRYTEEMLREEQSEAYRKQLGDFIDPRRVIELLEEGKQESEAEEKLPEEEIQDARSWRISYSTHEQAQTLFDSGEIAAAADLWSGIAADERAFTLSVEVDCSITMLKTTYAALQNLEPPIFVLREEISGRSCYRICLGVFATPSEAEAWIERVKAGIPEVYPFPHLIEKRLN